MQEFKNLKSVEDLEVFIQTSGFRQDPHNPEHRDFSEFRLITEDQQIKNQNWIRYQFIPDFNSHIDLKPIWEEIKRTKNWEILVENDSYHCLCALQMTEYKIILFLFDYERKDLFMIKLEILLNPVDFKRRLSTILGDYLNWGYETDRTDVMKLAYETSKGYNLGWVPPIDVRPNVE